MSGLVEFARRGKITLILDEHLLHLEIPLKIWGFKVLKVTPGMTDDEVADFSSNFILVTKNIKDFVHRAIREDFDLIDVSALFLDPSTGADNSTAQIISKAVRENSFPPSAKGNYVLVIAKDGKATVKPIS